MLSRIFILISLASICVWPLEASQPPHVILVMTDDQGSGDFGFAGNPVVATPNLDAMVKRSVLFRRFHVSPVCAPTRASLMTGRYNYRTRVTDTFLGRAMMDTQEITLAELLRPAGYTTGIFGKWHLGDSYPMRPQDQGFDEVLVHRGGGIGQPSDPPGAEAAYTDPVLVHNGQERRYQGYCTDVYFDHAMAFLERSHRSGKPAFIYLPTNAPHGPFDDVPEELRKKYAAMNLEGVYAGKVPPARQAGLDDTTSRIFAMIENVDDNMGRLFAHLKSIGAYENTLVLFLHDNGPNGPRYVGDLRGNKGQVWEGGIRSPLILHWPAKLKGGEVRSTLSAHLDLLPTILEAAEVQVPSKLHLDGISLWPWIRNPRLPDPDRHLVLQWHRGDVPVAWRNAALITSQYKLLHRDFNGDSLPDIPSFELYDLSRDPGEQRNLARELPDVLSQLRKKYQDWFQDVGSTRPDNYATPAIHLGSPYEPTTILTRQDWKPVNEGNGWAPDAQGYWKVYTDASADYRIFVRFRAAQDGEFLVLQSGGRVFRRELVPGQETTVLDPWELPEGDFRLDAWLEQGEVRRGIHQMELTRITME